MPPVPPVARRQPTSESGSESNVDAASESSSGNGDDDRFSGGGGDVIATGYDGATRGGQVQVGVVVFELV